tara:strand:+ start:40 stop:429 length:390 start_codon:yes stop_codon:yes gene_type:complete
MTQEYKQGKYIMSESNKINVLSNAKSHFRSALGAELQSIEVPEWNATIYFKTASSFMIEKKILDLHSKGSMVEALVETLLVKALNADGSKVFSPADKVVLMREVDPDVIIRVVTAMNSAKEEAKESLGN